MISFNSLLMGFLISHSLGSSAGEWGLLVYERKWACCFSSFALIPAMQAGWLEKGDVYIMNMYFYLLLYILSTIVVLTCCICHTLIKNVLVVLSMS